MRGDVAGLTRLGPRHIAIHNAIQTNVQSAVLRGSTSVEFRWKQRSMHFEGLTRSWQTLFAENLQSQFYGHELFSRLAVQWDFLGLTAADI